jgi:hypothetical protein
MGANIRGQGSDTLVISGVAELRGVEYTIIPDRIAAGTLMIAGAITRGDVTIKKTRPDDLIALQVALGECGIDVDTGDDWIRVRAGTVKGGTDVVTAPHPGFPTDLQPQMLAFLCTAPGVSVVEESIFNARFSYVNELVRMGADVRVAMENNTALVKGVASLSGAPVEAPDIRAGAGLVLAGLAAVGETEIIGLEYIDRRSAARCSERAGSSRSASRPGPSRPASTLASDAGVREPCPLALIGKDGAERDAKLTRGSGIRRRGPKPCYSSFFERRCRMLVCCGVKFGSACYRHRDRPGNRQRHRLCEGQRDRPSRAVRRRQGRAHEQDARGR